MDLVRLVQIVLDLVEDARDQTKSTSPDQGLRLVSVADNSLIKDCR